MKIDMNQQLETFDGRPIIVSEDNPFTLGLACCEALMFSDPQEKANGRAKLERYELAQRIHRACRSGDGLVDLTVDELKIVKDMAGKSLTTQAAGACWQALENAQSVKAVKAEPKSKRKAS